MHAYIITHYITLSLSLSLLVLFYSFFFSVFSFFFVSLFFFPLSLSLILYDSLWINIWGNGLKGIKADISLPRTRDILVYSSPVAVRLPHSAEPAVFPVQSFAIGTHTGCYPRLLRWWLCGWEDVGFSEIYVPEWLWRSSAFFGPRYDSLAKWTRELLALLSWSSCLCRAYGMPNIAGCYCTKQGGWRDSSGLPWTRDT